MIVALCAFTAALLLTPAAEAAGAPAVAASPALAIQLGAPFRDNAILQRDMDVPVWGWSEPGTRVTVEFGGQKVSTTAGKDGKWVAKLGKLKASFEPAQMVITESSGKSVTLKNILVGEVWMASGQSNMQWSCTKSSCNKLTAMLRAACEAQGISVNPIREFRVQGLTSQLHPIEKADGAWRDGDYLNYSAIAFAFAEKLYRELNVPIAILNCSFSQTPIEAWVPREGWATAEDDWSKAINLKCLQSDPRTPEHKEAWGAFYTSLEDQIAATEAALKKGETPKDIGAPVPGNFAGNRDANWLFNGQLNPVIPYAIRGAIWNQGYANMGKGISYYNNLHSLIRGWRIVWDEPDLPVYFHQFYTPAKTVPPPSIGSTAEMRLGTAMARDIPNAGMASQIDISGGIHYSNKAVPGRRLALHALKNQYGQKIVAEGPMFESYEVEGDKVIVEFDNAKGGLVVADTAFNRSREEGATGFADPTVIPNGEEKVELFWLCGEDRVWHPATCKIDGDEVIVTSKAVKKPRGVSYASGGVAFNPALYNTALLPMTPFIQYDNKMVTQSTWPDEKLKIAGETIDPSTVGKLYEFRKMPILSVQFRDNAVFQADKPVKIWGATRNFGEWKSNDEEGDCQVHVEFGKIKKTIPVEEGMAEWSVTLPPMKADGKAYTLKVSFTIDGELAHERVVKGIMFGDVWYVAAPAGIKAPAKGQTKDGEKVVMDESDGPIVRMIQNQSKRGGKAGASRYSVCVSRTPLNRFASFWKPASGAAKEIGDAIAAKTKRPVGIIWMQTKVSGPKGERRDSTTISEWMAPSFLKDAPSMMDDYKSVGSQYRDNPSYLENVRRYIGDWKGFWNDYIPEMIDTKAVPEGAAWGASWGSYPSPKPDIGDSKATYVYNVYVHSFTPAALKGVIFLTSESMVKEAGGANFGPEMTALAKSFKSRFGDQDAEFIYTIPSKTLAPKITTPAAIAGKSTAVEIGAWSDVAKVIEAAIK
jgi:hypothetical protein